MKKIFLTILGLGTLIIGLTAAVAQAIPMSGNDETGHSDHGQERNTGGSSSSGDDHRPDTSSSSSSGDDHRPDTSSSSSSGDDHRPDTSSSSSSGDDHRPDTSSSSSGDDHRPDTSSGSGDGHNPGTSSGSGDDRDNEVYHLADGGDNTGEHGGDDHGHNPVPTPEPATMLLLGSGLAGLATLQRRKKR